MKYYNVLFQPEGTRVCVHAGATILEAAGRAGIILDTVCGGRGVCRKCAVRLSPSDQEVLACQYEVQADLTVLVPVEARFFEQKILVHGLERQVTVSPCVAKTCLNITTTTPAALDAALTATFGAGLYVLGQQADRQLRQLPPELSGQGLTVIYRYSAEDISEQPPAVHILGFEHGDTCNSLFGVAVDIGTTTVVSKLVDLHEGQCLATVADMNPQTVFGDDVISRIAYADSGQKLQQLQQAIIDCINGQIQRVCRTAGIEPQNVYELVAAGNTTMNHIFLGFPIRQLGQAPYRAWSVKAHDVTAAELGLAISPAGNVHTIENIAGFVGSDTTAVALAVGLDCVEQPTLVVDIGTNGEVVLAAGGKLLAASCAAGPAFEGARISQGSRAVTGAIERVLVNGDQMGLEVIGAGRARSICGSGLIDAVAALLDLGVIDSTGRFVDADRLRERLPPSILTRIIQCYGQAGFVVAAGNGCEDVVLTQKDIREVQLAKGAIRTGIKLLQARMGVADADIQQVLLAGAFGNYIRREAALRIGLLPAVPVERIHFVGNAASSGAVTILVNRHCRALAGRLAGRIQYVEIAHEPDFPTVFAESMFFK
jgi:uncharacterized 2Fe-2S/4Fe-4S cluster protein (DUF4445 family)